MGKDCTIMMRCEVYEAPHLANATVVSRKLHSVGTPFGFNVQIGLKCRSLSVSLCSHYWAHDIIHPLTATEPMALMP